jgi:hypothetical protein
VLEGFWQQHETWDGTYTVDDLIEINALLDVRDENRRREAEYVASLQRKV